MGSASSLEVSLNIEDVRRISGLQQLNEDVFSKYASPIGYMTWKQLLQLQNVKYDVFILNDFEKFHLNRNNTDHILHMCKNLQSHNITTIYYPKVTGKVNMTSHELIESSQLALVFIPRQYEQNIFEIDIINSYTDDFKYILKQKTSSHIIFVIMEPNIIVNDDQQWIQTFININNTTTSDTTTTTTSSTTDSTNNHVSIVNFSSNDDDDITFDAKMLTLHNKIRELIVPRNEWGIRGIITPSHAHLPHLPLYASMSMSVSHQSSNCINVATNTTATDTATVTATTATLISPRNMKAPEKLRPRSSYSYSHCNHRLKNSASSSSTVTTTAISSNTTSNSSNSRSKQSLILNNRGRHGDGSVIHTANLSNNSNNRNNNNRNNNIHNNNNYNGNSIRKNTSSNHNNSNNINDHIPNTPRTQNQLLLSSESESTVLRPKSAQKPRVPSTYLRNLRVSVTQSNESIINDNAVDINDNYGDGYGQSTVDSTSNRYSRSTSTSTSTGINTDTDTNTRKDVNGVKRPVSGGSSSCGGGGGTSGSRRMGNNNRNREQNDNINGNINTTTTTTYDNDNNEDNTAITATTITATTITATTTIPVSVSILVRPRCVSANRIRNNNSQLLPLIQRPKTNHNTRNINSTSKSNSNGIDNGDGISNRIRSSSAHRRYMEVRGKSTPVLEYDERTEEEEDRKRKTRREAAEHRSRSRSSSRSRSATPTRSRSPGNRLRMSSPLGSRHSSRPSSAMQQRPSSSPFTSGIVSRQPSFMEYSIAENTEEKTTTETTAETTSKTVTVAVHEMEMKRLTEELEVKSTLLEEKIKEFENLKKESIAQCKVIQSFSSAVSFFQKTSLQQHTPVPNICYEGICQQTLSGHTGSVYSLLMAPNGIDLFSGGYDQNICHWSRNDGGTFVRIRTYKGHKGSIWSLLMISSDILISGSADNNMRLWDLNSGRCVGILPGHSGAVTCIARLDVNKFVSGSDDKTLRLWSISDYVCLKTIGGVSGPIYSMVVVTEDVIAVGEWSASANIVIFSMNTGSILNILSGHTKGIQGLVMSSHEVFFSVSDDGTLRVWNLNTLQCEHVVNIPSRSPTSALTLISDGSIVTGSQDSKIRIWSSLNKFKSALVEFKNDNGYDNVNCRLWRLVISCKGEIISSDADGIIKVWM